MGTEEPLTGDLRIGTMDSICDILLTQLLEEFINLVKKQVNIFQVRNTYREMAYGL